MNGLWRRGLAAEHKESMAERRMITAAEVGKLRRLWHDYYQHAVRVLEILRQEGTEEPAVERIAVEDAAAGRAMRQIKEILGVTER